MIDDDLKKQILKFLMDNFLEIFIDIAVGKTVLNEITRDIAEQKELYDKALTDGEKQKIKRNLQHLETQVQLQLETKKIKLVQDGETIINQAIKTTLNKFIPFV